MRARNAVMLSAAGVALAAGADAWAFGPASSPRPAAGVIRVEHARRAGRVHLREFVGVREGREVVFQFRSMRGCSVSFARLRVHGRRRHFPAAVVRRAVRRGVLRRDIRGRHVLLEVACARRSSVKKKGGGPPTTTTTTTTPPPTTAPAHTETWAYDDSASAGWCNGGYGASSSLVRQWVTYAETNCGPNATKALGDCHASGGVYCTVLGYLDANRIWPNNPIFTQNAPTQENWWLHQPGYTDASHRLTLPNSSYGTGYVLNQTTPAAQQWFQGYLRSNFDAWDGVMADDTGGGMSAQFYHSGFSSSEEITTDAGVLAGHEQMAQALTHSNGTPFLQVDNGIDPNPYLPTTLPLLNNPSSVVGLVAEGEPWADGVQSFFPSLLDDMAYVDTTANDFIVLLSYDQNAPLTARRVQEATVLLGYSAGHTVDWADLEQDNLDLAVWPEEGIYPTRPVQSMGAPGGSGCLSGTGAVCSSGGHNDVQVAPGVYRREFSTCFNQGVPFGHCAAIVNHTSQPVTVSPSWLTQSYSHQIAMSGGDVQSGGTINTAGGTFLPGSTAVPADDALLLSQ